jgi:hypothetical protein
MFSKIAFPLFFAASLYAQSSSLDQILARLDRLESENQKLLEEVHKLRQELKAAPNAAPPGAAATAGSPSESVSSASSPSASTPSASTPPVSASVPPIEERVDVIERRMAEVDQTKVRASERFPLTISGMALFNAFSNGKYGGALQDPLTAAVNPGPRVVGASFRQTVLGLRYDGPEAFAGGKISGALDLDLWGGDSTSLNHLIRMRTATIRIDWQRTSVSVGQDKPLISPRDPDSLAQVAFSPFTAAGNPWLWQPQVRVEQRFSVSETSGVRLQGSLYQTRESFNNLPAAYQSSTVGARPGWEGRAEFWKRWGDQQKLEVASGFHTSFSRVDGESIPSEAFSFDWLVDPLPRWEITGAFYRGQNLAGIGGAGGITLLPNEMLTAVHQNSGWIQSSFRLTPRLKVNAFAGDQSLRPADLLNGALQNNLAWGGNLMFHLAPNVIASFEALQLRTKYMNIGLRVNDHYDLAIAYLF